MTAEARHDERIPRALLIAIAALVLTSTAAVFVGRATGVGVAPVPQAEAVQTRRLSFERGRRTLTVREAGSRQMVALLEPGEDGFIRGVLRGLSRGRAVRRIDGGEVYVLTRWSDGRLSITDPATGARFDLNLFGDDNFAAFARLMTTETGR